jgi:hypothetical protein
MLFVAGNALAADLIGTVSRSGAPVKDAPVILKYEGSDAGSTKSDATGRFVIRNLRPGVYELHCGDRPAVKVKINDGPNQINCQG